MVISVFVTGFFAAYFQLLNHPAFPVTVMPRLAPDRWVAFVPAALAPYVSLWLYAFLAPTCLRGRGELAGYAGGALLLTIVGLGLFYLWPTTIERLTPDDAGHPAFGLLQRIDLAGNACPSLHVAFAVFSALWIERMLRAVAAPHWTHLANGAWCAAIAWSTMATKQHVAVDVLAGIALGLAGGAWYPGEWIPQPVTAAGFFPQQTLAVLLSLTSKLLIPALGLWPEHALISGLLFFGPDLWILGGLLMPNATQLMPVVRSFATPRREIWLTIDDGPDPATTRPMLDLLDRHGARATFFFIGTKVAAHPGLAAEALRRGHGVGNHTHTHPLATFWIAGPRRTENELGDCDAALRSAGLAPGPWFRAPAGIKNLFLHRILRRRSGVLVGWTGRGREYASTSPEQPLRRLKRKIRPGAILLLHESASHGEERLALLRGLLEHLTASGYRCVVPGPDDLR